MGSDTSALMTRNPDIAGVPIWEASPLSTRINETHRAHWEYALPMSRRNIYGVAFAAAGFAALFAFLPRLRPFLWPGIAWSILLVSAIAVFAVLINLGMVIFYMYTGYRSETGDVGAAKSLNKEAEPLRFKERTGADEPRKAA